SDEARLRLTSIDSSQAERAARSRFEAQQAFETAKRRDRVDAIDKFLAAFPECDFVEEARTLRSALRARDQLFKETMAGNDPGVLKGFLATYPEGFVSDQVRRRL